MFFHILIYRQLIYNYPEQLFGAAGVMAIEHADFAGVERLALVTGMKKRHLTCNIITLEFIRISVCNSFLKV